MIYFQNSTDMAVCGVGMSRSRAAKIVLDELLRTPTVLYMISMCACKHMHLGTRQLYLMNL